MQVALHPLMMRKRVGLALSGGAAHGLIHVGVLQVLEREQVPVDYIAGSSAGSLVGLAYAAGLRAEQLAQMARTVRWGKIASPAWSRTGLVSLARMESWLVQIAGDLTFADLAIPYAAVAADLETGEAVILREGRVAPAVRASCAVPGLMRPVEWNGRLLVDGGVANNLPISVVRDMGADVVIAVDLVLPPLDRPKGMLEIAVVALHHLLARAADNPSTADVHIGIRLDNPSSLVKLSAGDRLMAEGREAAEKALPDIKAILAGVPRSDVGQ